MSETLIDLAHKYMGEFAYGMYRKRVYGGPTSGAYSGGGKRARVVAPLTAKVKALQRKVALLSPEVKVYETAITDANITAAAGAISYISDILQGTADSNRIGDKVHAKSLSIRFRIGDFGTASSSNPGTYCFTLIQDKESNGVIPSIAGGVNSIFSSFDTKSNKFILPSTSDRFKILKQKYVSANALVYGVGGGPVWDWKVPLNSTMTFNSSAGTVADASKGALYMVTTTTDASSTIDLVYGLHLYFTDV